MMSMKGYAMFERAAECGAKAIIDCEAAAAARALEIVASQTKEQKNS
jgi:hypothetical protein